MKVKLNGHDFNGKDPLVTGTDMRIMRLKGNKTTAEMANIAGVKTRKTYENWEQNASQPNVNQFMALAVACGFDPGLLLASFVRRGNISISGVDPYQINWDDCRLAAVE